MRGTRDRLSDGYIEIDPQARRPRKLAGILTVICFVAAVLLGGHLVVSTARSNEANNVLGKDEPAATSAVPSASQTSAVLPSTSAATPTASASEEGTDHHGSAKRPAQSVAMVAARFVDAWLLRKPPASRLVALRAVASEYLATSLAATDPNALPTSSRYGMPKLMTWTALSASYRVWLRNGQTVDLMLTPDGGPNWKVIALEPGPPSKPSNPIPSSSTR